MELPVTMEANGIPLPAKDDDGSRSVTKDTNGNLSTVAPASPAGASSSKSTAVQPPGASPTTAADTTVATTSFTPVTVAAVAADSSSIGQRPAGGSTSKNKKKKKKKSSSSSGTTAGAAATGAQQAGAGAGTAENGNIRNVVTKGTAASLVEDVVRSETGKVGGTGDEVGAIGASPSEGTGGGAAAASNGADILRLLKKKQIESLVAKAGAKATKEHKFWDTQPMKKHGEDVGEPGEIETKTIQDVRPEPYNMPQGFEWCHVNVMDETEAEEVYTLLSENYVEDDDNMFRFDYSKEFLRWALTPPGYSAELHVGVRSSRGKLVALITAVPTQMRVNESSIRTVEINFLCVHKKLRSKRLAPVLIKEVTRRVNLMGVWQAVYTAGVVLPTPLACCRYFHRSLNPKKLIEVGFSRLSNRMTMARTLKLYKLPDRTQSANICAMSADDVSSVHELLTRYLKQFKLAPELTEEEIAHWLLPREGVVDCFVVKDGAGKVTDMCSFYHLPSTVIGHEKHRTLNAAYSFYNVATTRSMTSRVADIIYVMQTMLDNYSEFENIDRQEVYFVFQMSITELMRDSLILARNLGMDVFNALNLMQNQDFLQTLKFGIGDGHLQYYLYNWRCKEITPEDVGLVLL